ncbi:MULTISPECIES: efflux transporter outer membrane subunit [unclassified Duganella]|uniref:efflux transporter outer membrane subunit n=1 Tax=unclassified Duganella TaxID=2636909 RepID=UPI00088550CB|nr:MULTISPECIES: efflux transporter outer membrane subunit [unclassified Duganella]SDG44727.1 efflux transporter, outer membrane factor (OMF) lipoprotein, NodT family [Duganella sp. OV458]SDJ59171.1 efflux transporter, outer membrane factor (OMF) lipoprotein, NodT family [Duganella sp. OV510]
MRKRIFRQFHSLALRAGTAALIAAGMGGCALGPDFKTPAAPATAGDSYTPTPLPQQTASSPGFGGAAQQFAFGQEIPAQWWTLFRSPALDQLIRSALEQNPNMAAAEAALRQAQENYNAQAGNLVYPSVNAQLGAARQKTSVTTAGTAAGVYNVYNASVNVAYTPDVFGGTRRTLEGARAAIDYQRFQVEATYLTLSANVVTTAIQEASLRAQLQATREVLDALTRQQNVIEKQFEYGAIPRTTVLSQRNQVAQINATIAPLEKALAAAQHQLSVLAGKLPGEAGMPQFTLESLTLPEQLPVSLPSTLVRQRPDIRASEELLHQASAAIGVATAAQYPQFTLSGSYGSSAASFGKLFDAETTAWSLAAGIAQPIFNGGALSAQRRAAEAAYDTAAAQYRATVLTAFQNVADTLRALDADAAALKSQAEAESLAKETLTLAQEQYKLGGISYLVLLDAQRSFQQAHINLVQAQAARYADTAALFQALGGGWWNRANGVPAATAVSAAAPYGASGTNK